MMNHLIPMPLDFIPGGIIFDCDGTLADTMPLHYQAWRQTLDAIDCPYFPEDEFYAWGGVTAREIAERLNRNHGLSLDAEAVAQDKERTYQRLIPGVQPIPIVVDEARRFFGVVPMAVASGGLNPMVEETLRTLGIRHLFGPVVASEDVTRGKPEPDVFLVAAQRLGVAPEVCVVFEDAPAGLEAARRAGMRAVDINRYR